MTTSQARQRFAEAVSRADDDIDLARAALYIAAEEYPALDVEEYVRRLDAFAEQVAPALSAFRSPADAFAEMRSLFTRERFRGNTEDYFDPRNSFLNDVLDRRTGIPITLSIVYLEIGWRCGLPIVGVGFPGHFVVKYAEPGGEHYVDVFDGARTVSLSELRARLVSTFGGEARLGPEHIAGVSRRHILIRLNANLKGVYMQRGDLARALAAVERILVLSPDAPQEIRDRGLLHFGLHAYGPAARDLERYLAIDPAAPDADEVRKRLAHAARERVRLN